MSYNCKEFIIQYHSIDEEICYFMHFDVRRHNYGECEEYL